MGGAAVRSLRAPRTVGNVFRSVRVDGLEQVLGSGTGAKVTWYAVTSNADGTVSIEVTALRESADQRCSWHAIEDLQAAVRAACWPGDGAPSTLAIALGWDASGRFALVPEPDASVFGDRGFSLP